MALRGKKPTAIEKRLKVLIFGPAGSGKTTAAIQFPRPYLIDTERGAENDQYVRLLDKAGGAYFGTSDFEDMVKEVTSLLSERHEFKTLIVDPITVVYADLVEKAGKKVGTDFGRHYQEANKRMKHLLNLLVRLDMNVIITAHAKKEYGDNMVVLGQTFDGWNKLDYLFDLVVEIQKSRDGKERAGLVRKSRIETLPENTRIEPWSYQSLADKYGRAVLERDAVPEQLATTEQVGELKRLIAVLKLEDGVVEKWLDKARAETLAELPADVADKCIVWCKKQIENGSEAA